MTQTPEGDEPKVDSVVDSVVERTALVVWVARDAAGNVEGTVERARTGAKERFHGLDSLAEVVERMTER